MDVNNWGSYLECSYSQFELPDGNALFDYQNIMAYTCKNLNLIRLKCWSKNL